MKYFYYIPSRFGIRKSQNMKKYLLSFSLLCLTVFFSAAQQNALLSNGRLKVVGKQLSNQCGDPVQLRGMSSHAPMGPQQDCYKASSMAALANTWGADVFRLAMYTEDVGESKGYINGDRAFWNKWIDQMVDLAEENGMYIIIDWHILKDNNPFTHVGAARTFFGEMSARYANRRHVLYEICNEPNGGVSWGTIKSYAQEIIPIIRANDPNGIILVGTPEWCSKPQDAAANPLTGNYAHNVMYTVHFYANTHYWQNDVANAASKIPIFVSEWGSVDASGNGGFNQGNSDTWLNLLNNASGQKISHCNWSFVDKDEAASALTDGACLANNWTSRTTAGNYIYNKLRTGDNFSSCSAAGDSDGDGVTNGEDQCPGTPANSYVDAQGCVNESDDDGDGVVNQEDNCPGTPQGTTVNAVGCEIANDFISNVCMGFNNSQNYLRSDFNFVYGNIFAWNTEVGESSVYYANEPNGELVIDVTNADPDYAAQGFSFGENEDGSLVEFDMSAHKVIEMDLKFIPSGSYSASDVLFRIQIEDANGDVINSDALENDFRQLVKTGNSTWTHVSFDFADGINLYWNADEGCEPCKYTDFDYTRITKIIMFCNPGAGESWSRPQFTGQWKIDNLEVGFDGNAGTCDAIRDDDGDGVRVELDECPNTISGVAVDADGCANYQLDDDKDGVSNADDQCANTPANAPVNSVGCDAVNADDDEDGVKNNNDQCPATPNGTPVDASGCPLNLDDDEDGVNNDVDLCPNTVANASVDADGCSQAQRDDDNDGTPNGSDGCPDDPNKIAAGVCGCGTADVDTDNDNTPDCNDLCPNDPNKTAPGSCGCGVAEGTCVDCFGTPNGTGTVDACGKCIGGPNNVKSDDADNDGTPDCNDQCPNDANKIVPGTCGCGVAENQCSVDCFGTVDGTGTTDVCGKCIGGPINVKSDDADNDGTPDCNDQCKNDPNKTTPGTCGCGVAETDSDNDNTPDCDDECPNDPTKIKAGLCGCDVPEGTCQTDCNGDAGGSAFMDNCGNCVAGQTGLEPCDGVLEGEDYCSLDGKVSTDFTGTSGTGYANFTNELGATAVWVLNSIGDQTVTFTFRHTYGATEHRNTEVFVNGVSQGIIQFTNTGGWGTWANVNYDLDLLDGPNNISLVSVSTDGGSNIDRITWGKAAVVIGSCDEDCAGTVGGRAITDACGKCVGGESGATSDDSDNDGILNCVDQCQNTPTGVKVDNVGCTVTGFSKEHMSSVNIFPVPTTDNVTIEQLTVDYNRFTVMTLTGTVVQEGRLSNSVEEISLDELSQGVYIIQLFGTNSAEQFRIVKD